MQLVLLHFFHLWLRYFSRKQPMTNKDSIYLGECGCGLGKWDLSTLMGEPRSRHTLLKPFRTLSSECNSTQHYVRGVQERKSPVSADTWLYCTYYSCFKSMGIQQQLQNATAQQQSPHITACLLVKHPVICHR